MHRAALSHLRAADPVLARLIDAVGPCRLKPAAELSFFEALARSIVFQQLSNHAASTIYGRVQALFDDQRPSAEALVRLSDGQLRSAGVSSQKLKYLRDLADQVASGRLPLDAIDARSDDEVITLVTQVKGIGRWTAQMFLLFRLGRPDVLPELDLGVQKAIQRAYRLRKLPTPERVLRIGRPWAPHRSVASWYLWRSLELEP